MNIRNKMDRELEKIEVEKITPVNNEKINEIIDSIKHLDTDLKPLLDTISRLLEEIDDQSFKTHILRRILKFYGFGNGDILSTRQKFIIMEGQLVKRPFLKQNQKDCINILLDDLDINL